MLLVLALVAGVRDARAIPSDDLLNSLRPTADVNDFAGILSPAEKAAIEARCRELRERTGSQLAVVTLKSLEGGDVVDFSFKLAEKWGIHQKGQKNGMLLLVAMAEHKFWIQVGYDLEPIIPDVLAGRILNDQLRPQFRAGQYGAGLLAATNEIVDRVEKGVPADRAALDRRARHLIGRRIRCRTVSMFVCRSGRAHLGRWAGTKNGAGCDVWFCIQRRADAHGLGDCWFARSGDTLTAGALGDGGGLAPSGTATADQEERKVVEPGIWRLELGQYRDFERRLVERGRRIFERLGRLWWWRRRIRRRWRRRQLVKSSASR